MAMFEVFKPALKGQIDIHNNCFQAATVGSFGFIPYGIFELDKAFLSGPSVSSFEVVTKKIKTAFLRCIHNVRLFRM